jgi:hypothetical protein
MICRTPTDSTSRTIPKTFTNWARALTFTAARSFRPSTRGEIVEIIRQAEDAGQRVKWTGSVWAFMGLSVSNDVVIESDDITGVIDRTLILDHLTLADEALRESLVQIRGGTKVFNVNRLLHGLPQADNGGGDDEVGLSCDSTLRALPTLGGSGGQSIAGVMATGSHGGDLHLPPIADCVQAIHLIGPGGQEFWIERSSGLTVGSEADTQSLLRATIDADPRVATEMCTGILVKKDDDLFRAVLVSVGRMGFVYSLVIKTVSAFKLEETRSAEIWETYRANLGAEMFNAFTESKYFLNVIIIPFGNAGQHDCKVTERVQKECSIESTPPEPGGGFLEWLCRQQDVAWIAAILIAAIAVLVLAIVGLVEAVSIMLAVAATLVVTFFWVGWVLAALMYVAIAVVVAVIIALGVTVAALVALLAYITGSGGLTPGQLVAAITNFAFTFGLQEVMRSILVGVFNSAYPPVSRTDIGWKVMDTYGYGENFCQKVDAMEIAFDVAAATGGGGYLAFIDEVLAIFDDLYGRHIAVAFILSLRYTSNTEALIGMSKFSNTCHIEIPAIRDFAGNAEFIERVQRAAIAHNGVPHWGQLMGTYTARDILDLHGSDLTLWRQKLTQLIREGERANRTTFSNSFTSTYNLEPLDDTPISAVRLTIVVGDDSLGDRAHPWRDHISADVAQVVLNSGTVFEISLNEGTEWSARTTHVRDVPVDSGTIWGDIRSVVVKHAAAGPDFAADNWTMDGIVISSVSADGDVREQFRQHRTPVWQFRKNDNQVWQHDFV